MGEELFGKKEKEKSTLSSIIAKAEAVSLPKAISVPNTDSNMIIDKSATSTTDLLLKSSSDLKSSNESNARIVCYYTNWSHKRPGAGKFSPEDLDPTLCTHLVFAFANLNSDFKLVASEPSDAGKGGLYERVIALKAKNPLLKVSLAVGGWMMGPTPFKTLTESSYRQTLFTFNAVDFLRTTGFDGLEIAWEFPRGNEDKERFSKLLKVSNLELLSLTEKLKLLEMQNII